MNKSTWREQRVTVPAQTPVPVNWTDTSPNIIIIANNGNSRVYVGQSANVGPSTYDLIVPPYGTRLYARPLPITTMWVYSLVETRIHVASMEGEFSPLMISQTQEISALAASGLLGVVDVNQILSPLPAGTNEIGSVQISGFGEPLPEGNNLIGRVQIENAPLDVNIYFDSARNYINSLAPSMANLVGGSDGTNLRPLLVAADGRLIIQDTVELVITTTPLDASGTYYSGALDIRRFGRLVGYASADQDGTLTIEHSHDGSTFVPTHNITVTAGTPTHVDIPTLAPYALVKYTNGANPQTTFTLAVFGKVV